MSNSLFGLEGKNVIVLGGGQGMGESTSKYLSRVGCNVAVIDMDLSRAERVAAEVTKQGSRGMAYAVDATNDKALQDTLTQVDKDMGGVDGMACIIGMAGWASLLEMTPDQWDLDHRRNLRYFFLAAQTIAGSMIRRGKPGSIVGVTSIDGIRSAPYHASYGAAKAGLINLVRSMSSEWAALGVRANTVAPGAIITPRIPEGTSEEEKARMRMVPMLRRGTTDDIGKAILFLLSDLSAYVTGQTLAVDGGFTSVGPIDYADRYKKVGSGTLGLSAKS
jgi:NAD(P)-dependent dehydrogenase (short-subunit alcohol dehydrogenase family)